MGGGPVRTAHMTSSNTRTPPGLGGHLTHPVRHGDHHAPAPAAQGARRRRVARRLLRPPDQPVLIVTRTTNTRSLDLAARFGFRPVSTFEAHEAEQTLAMTGLHSFLAG